jgi:hypothetical protein
MEFRNAGAASCALRAAGAGCIYPDKEAVMTTKLLSIAAATALLLGSFAIVHAQSSGGTNAAPGSFGASPGADIQSEGNKGGSAASGFAPGRENGGDDALSRADGDQKVRTDGDDRTSGFGRDSDDRLSNDRADQMMDTDTRGVGKE